MDGAGDGGYRMATLTRANHGEYVMTTQKVHRVVLNEQQSDQRRNLLLSSAQPRLNLPSFHPVNPCRLDCLSCPTKHMDFAELADRLVWELSDQATDATIQQCGPAPIRIIRERPNDVLALAAKHLSATPYHEVQKSWRRLYEDACLWRVVHLSRHHSSRSESDKETAHWERTPSESRSEVRVDSIGNIIEYVDKAIIVAGAPRRAAALHFVCDRLAVLLQSEHFPEIPHRFETTPPSRITAEFPITRSECAVAFGDFQSHLDVSLTPLIMPDVMEMWSATENWQDPNYFMRVTLGGRRLVPVELGNMYTDDSWSQELMPFGRFMRSYMLPRRASRIGYLAQHDIFEQMPELAKGIVTPDYCFTTPPRPADGLHASRSSTPLQPIVHVWMGPAGTRTPLHTDAYHNILCQVVGYKYVRLYSPSQSPRMYPRGSDAQGIDMANTSAVDISEVRRINLGRSPQLLNHSRSFPSGPVLDSDRGPPRTSSVFSHFFTRLRTKKRSLCRATACTSQPDGGTTWRV